MKTRSLFASLSIAAFLAILPVAARASVVIDRVVAVVNNDIITLSDLQREEALQKASGKDEDSRLLLEDMIDRKLQLDAAKNAGIEVSDKELDDAMADIRKRNGVDEKEFASTLAQQGLTVAQYRRELRQQITLSRMFDKYVRSGISITDAEIRSYYERNQKEFAQPEELRLSQLVFPLPDKPTAAEIAKAEDSAQAAVGRLHKGVDMQDLVQELATPATRDQDGDLGYSQRDQLLPAMQTAVASLKIGDVSAPFRCTGGIRVVQVTDIRTPEKSFAQVKDTITDRLYQQKLMNTYRTWLQSLRTDAHIENLL